MKKSIGIIALIIILFSGCDIDESLLENFDSDLRGTWVSTRTFEWWETVETGKLVITYDTITITGYVLPLNSGYIKNTELDGYSEETSSDGNTAKGTLFIKDIGGLKSVPYELLHADSEEVLAVGIEPTLEKFKRE
jgi:hypothetical protein